MPNAILRQGSNSLSIDYTPSGADVAAGEIIITADRVGIADRPIADGELGALVIGQSVWDITKEDGVAINDGEDVFWDDTGKQCTNVGPADAYLGKAVGDWAAAAADAPTARVALFQATP